MDSDGVKHYEPPLNRTFPPVGSLSARAEPGPIDVICSLRTAFEVRDVPGFGGCV